MSNSNKDDEDDESVSLLSLSNDILINCITYLEFSDIANVVSELNMRFKTLSADRNALYGITNYPCYKSILSLANYMNELIENQNVSSFNYRIKKIDWLLGSFHFEDGGVFTIAIQTLFQQLKHLKYLKFSGSGFIFLQNLPLQTHLTRLILQCTDQYIWHESSQPNFKVTTFLQTKIDVNSLYLLKEFSVSDMIINGESLKVLSNMINLEIFRFEGLQFDDVDVLVNKKLIQTTFTKWTKLEILDSYTQQDKSTCIYSTFEDYILNDVVLTTLLSIKTLKSLRFSVSPWNAYIKEDNDQNEPFASRIRRIFPCFFNLNGLECLEYCIFQNENKNILLMVEILKIIKTSANKPLKSVKINADTNPFGEKVDINIDNFKGILFQSFSMIQSYDSYFEIKLPQKKEWLMIFAKIIKQYSNSDKIKFKQLLISMYCESISWKYFVDNCCELSEILHKVSNSVRMDLIGQSFATRPYQQWRTRLNGTKWDGCDSSDSNEPYVHKDWKQLEKRLKKVGFRLNCLHKHDEGIYVESLNWQW